MTNSVRLRDTPDRWSVTADHDGLSVASGSLDWWDEADGTRVYLASGNVDSAWRRRGIGRAVIDRLAARAAEHWRAEPGSGPPLLGANADDVGTARFLTATGFRVRFSVVVLGRDPAGAADLPLPSGIQIRHAGLPAVQQALKTCFADSGNGQEVRDWTRLSVDPGLTLVAWSGDEVAGVVASEREDDGTSDTPWVAVLPSWRRRGLARALVHRSLRLLAGQGIRWSSIRTVQENRNHTVELYESCGYRVTARHPRYARPLTVRPR